MKNLYLMRHATSDWSDTTVSDEERTITLQGYTDIDSIAYHLNQQGIKPELIVSSCAIRAQETSLALAKFLHYTDKIHYLKEFYLASAQRMQETITLQPNECDNIFIIGHDRQLREFIEAITKEKVSKIPTSSVIALNLDINHWSELEAGKGDIAFSLYPHQDEEALAS